MRDGRGTRLVKNVAGRLPVGARSVRPGPVALSVLGTIAAFIALAIVGSVLAQRMAEKEAQEHVRVRGAMTAQVALAPFLVDGIFEGDPLALEALDDAAQELIGEGEALHLRIWSESGRVLWADTNVEGETFELSVEESRLFGTQDSTYSVGLFDKPENAFDGPATERVLEIYLGSSTSPSATPVLVETYYSYALVSDRAKELRNSFLPILIGGLALLAAAQIPLTSWLVRRLEGYQLEREHLLLDVIETKNVERQRIAAQVHDGALQDLIGVSYELSGVAASAPGKVGCQLELLGIEVRRTIRSFRSILNSVYPTDAQSGRWITGQFELIDVLRSRGVDLTIDVPDFELTPQHQDLIQRTASEALRNAASHSQCKSLIVRLERTDECLRLIVRDDGCGFSADVATSQRRAGHFGLQLMSDLASESGASLTVQSQADSGTEVRLEILETVRVRV